MPHRFAKSTIHTGDQPGPPSLYEGDVGQTAKMSSGTSKYTVGNAQKYCLPDVSKHEVNLIGGDEMIDAKWMDGKPFAESACLGKRNDKF